MAGPENKKNEEKVRRRSASNAACYATDKLLCAQKTQKTEATRRRLAATR